ncbi:anthrax toxin lethal factor-related metalloendopeptidase [Metabacillus malikii]|uniref:ATLF-like domain-containing protein n=1 Tax=Metabacillus malikii TaxID=1504265 RepID=A0ABT9Z9B0_9BACI|nr:toxin [Metabacillus malikii]MDQ0228851.1 hypothetical protein [Metabacillus malikii]
MRKGFFIFFCFFITIPIFFLIGASQLQGIKLSTYTFQKVAFSLSKPVLGEIVFLPESAFNEEEVITMLNNLEKIDNNILNLAEKKDIKIKLFKGSLTEQDGLQRLKSDKPRGYTNNDPNWESVPGMSEESTVYVKIGHSEYGKGHSSVALELHEFAHAIDRQVFFYVRKDPMFISIWKQEADRLFPSQHYFVNFAEEYFAEAFAMYYYNSKTNEALFKTAPLTYSFLQSLEMKAAELVK